MEAFVEDLIQSAETNPEADEEMIALGNPNLVERRLFRRTRHGIDIDPFAFLRPPGLELPFVMVDQEAVTEYIQACSSIPTVLVAPRAKQILFTTSRHETVSLQFDLENPLELARALPLADEIVETFEECLEYLRDLPEEAGIEPFGGIRAQFESLDQDQLQADFTDLLGGAATPILRRYTSEGFQPILP